MEIRRAFFAGWMGCGALLFCGGLVDGGWHPSPRMFGSGREVVVGVVGRRGGRWGLMRAGGLSGFPGVG